MIAADLSLYDPPTNEEAASRRKGDQKTDRLKFSFCLLLLLCVSVKGIERQGKRAVALMFSHFCRSQSSLTGRPSGQYL